MLLLLLGSRSFFIYLLSGRKSSPPPYKIIKKILPEIDHLHYIIVCALSLTPLVHGTNIGIVTSLTDFYRLSSIVKVESASYRWWASGAVCFWNEFSSIGKPFCARCLMKIETPQRWERERSYSKLAHSTWKNANIREMRSIEDVEKNVNFFFVITCLKLRYISWSSLRLNPVYNRGIKERKWYWILKIYCM